MPWCEHANDCRVLGWFRDWAESAPDPVVADELWGFVIQVERRLSNGE